MSSFLCFFGCKSISCAIFANTEDDDASKKSFLFWEETLYNVGYL